MFAKVNLKCMMLIAVFIFQNGTAFCQTELVGERNYTKKGTEWVLKLNNREARMRPGAITIRFKEILPDSLIADINKKLGTSIMKKITDRGYLLSIGKQEIPEVIRNYFATGLVSDASGEDATGEINDTE